MSRMELVLTIMATAMLLTCGVAFVFNGGTVSILGGNDWKCVG
jgi:hypothetical protein